MALKENYKDDILDVSQNVKRKYQMENNGDGTVSFTDVTEYTQQGDSFGASDMNATNGKVNTLESDIGEINDNLTDGIGGTTDKFRFGTDGNGNYGYIKKVEGADTFFPFSGEVDGEIYIPTNVVSPTQNIRATSSNRRYILGLYQGNNYYANQSLYDTVNNVWVNITNDILTKIADKFKLTQTFNQLSDISYAMKKDATGFYFTNVSSYYTKAMFIYTDSIS